MTSSFTAKRLNKSTIVVLEDDAYNEHPLIYVKIHPKAPVIILTDTGTDEPSEEKKHCRFTRLRDYLENCPLECNGDTPINSKGRRQYIIICSHCHYDHIGGISQFLEGGTTEIIASSSGRDFIESDLEKNGEFLDVGKPAPYYLVTHWAQHFERLSWPITHEDDDEEASRGKPVDLDITVIPTPGHTPDSLSWYDHEEMHLYVGDTLYEGGPDHMPIIWPVRGNFIEWVFQTSKLQYMVKGQNAQAEAAAEQDSSDGWVQIARRVRVGCGHQTYSADAEVLFATLGKFGQSVLRGEVPVVKKQFFHGDAYYTWREKDGSSGLSFAMPARLMDDARRFFKGTIVATEDQADPLLPTRLIDEARRFFKGTIYRRSSRPSSAYDSIDKAL